MGKNCVEGVRKDDGEEVGKNCVEGVRQDDGEIMEKKWERIV